MSNQPTEAEILRQLSALSERVSRLEENQLLLTDIDRYEKLRNLLVAGKFKEADRETAKVLLEVSGESSRETLTPEDIKQFPCNVLRIINRLWLNSSQGRFGFSVQLHIYQSVGGNVETLMAQDIKLLEQFGDCVGWRENGQWRGDTYEQWDFTLKAPEGCFPAAWWKSPYGAKMVNYFFMQLISCEI
jgi:hypothetical protein